MTIRQCIEQLLEVEEKRQEKGESVCVCSVCKRGRGMFS